MYTETANHVTSTTTICVCLYHPQAAEPWLNMVTSRFSPITHALSSFGSPHFDLSIARAGKLRAMAAAYNNNNNNNSAPVFYWSSLTRWWWSGAATAHRRESFAWSVAQRWWPKSFKDPISLYAKMVHGGVVWCVCFILSSFIIIFKRDSPISLAPAQQVSSLHKKLCLV